MPPAGHTVIGDVSRRVNRDHPSKRVDQFRKVRASPELFKVSAADAFDGSADFVKGIVPGHAANLSTLKVFPCHTSTTFRRGQLVRWNRMFRLPLMMS